MAMKGDLPQNWAFFRAQYENYEIATSLDKKDEAVRIATLMSVMGRECFRIYQHIDMSGEDRKDIAKVLDALQKHFEPTRNVIYERFKFNTCVQEQGETIDQYITKLKQMAATYCKFEQLENELIRDRLVLGAKDSSAKARMLREPNLDIQKAIDMCRNSEIANAQWKTMNNELDGVAAVNYTSNEKKSGGSKKKEGLNKNNGRTKEYFKESCKYCGGKHKRDKKQCPAYGETCNNCKKKHHFARVCKQKVKKDVHAIMEEQSSDESL
ncbi:Hypothetical predicted protein [Paramuricea clavata]|nr:Hypothetical predicted protein [Paramuricea clavata]